MLNKSGGLSTDLRKELIDYYKWVVSLAIFVLTVSLSLSSLVEGETQHKPWLLAGWFLLAICILANWLLIKTLLAAAVAERVPANEWTALHRLLAAGVTTRQKIYANVQNSAFLIGVLCVGLGFVWSL